MADDLKTLKEKVAANTDPKASAELLVNGVADQLDQLEQDPVAIKALAAEMRKDASGLGEAIMANTHPTVRQGTAPYPTSPPKSR